MFWEWLSEMFCGYLLMKDRDNEKKDDKKANIHEKPIEVEPEEIDVSELDEETRFEIRYRSVFEKKKR